MSKIPPPFALPLSFQDLQKALFIYLILYIIEVTPPQVFGLLPWDSWVLGFLPWLFGSKVLGCLPWLFFLPFPLFKFLVCPSLRFFFALHISGTFHTIPKSSVSFPDSWVLGFLPWLFGSKVLGCLPWLFFPSFSIIQIPRLPFFAFFFFFCSSHFWHLAYGSQLKVFSLQCLLVNLTSKSQAHAVLNNIRWVATAGCTWS